MRDTVEKFRDIHDNPLLFGREELRATLPSTLDHWERCEIVGRLSSGAPSLPPRKQYLFYSPLHLPDFKSEPLFALDEYRRPLPEAPAYYPTAADLVLIEKQELEVTYTEDGAIDWVHDPKSDTAFSVVGSLEVSLERADIANSDYEMGEGGTWDAVLLLDGAQLLGIEMICSNLSYQSLRHGVIRASSFEGILFREVDFFAVDIAADCIFRRCDFTGSNFCQADLAGVRFEGSSFLHADLRGADLCGADLSCCDLDSIRFDETTFRERARIHQTRNIPAGW